MPQHRDGREPTLAEIQQYADKIERKLLAMQSEIDTMTEHDLYTEKAINALSLQQERMASDIKEINEALKSVASSLSNLAVLEQKHVDSMDAIKRAHHRLDKIQEDFVKHRDKFETKLNALELHQAKNIWIERLAILVLTGLVALWFNTPH